MINQHFENLRKILEGMSEDVTDVCKEALASHGDTQGLSAVERMVAPRGVPQGLTPGTPRNTPVVAPVTSTWSPVDPWEGLAAPAAALTSAAAQPSVVTPELLSSVLAVYGVTTTSSHVATGPTVTTHVLGIPVGSRVSSVVSRESDLARDLGVDSVRIIDRVPGHPGCIGVEMPNKTRVEVSFRSVLLDMPESEGSPVVALGVNTLGRSTWRKLSDLPHMLVAGASKSGKSIFLHSLVCSVVARHTPETVKLVLVDPKRVEFGEYAALPHMAIPVAHTAGDALAALDYLVAQLDVRKDMLVGSGHRDIQAYHAAGGRCMPYVLAVIDEYSALMMSGGKGTAKAVEEKILRLAQEARAFGIHLVLATQRPSADVVTGAIKANMQAKAVFRVSSAVDSRVVMDTNGAEGLRGNGDMLYSDDSGTVRIQGVMVDDSTRKAVCRGGTP